jgi:hypothetical protein
MGVGVDDVVVKDVDQNKVMLKIFLFFSCFYCFPQL